MMPNHSSLITNFYLQKTDKIIKKKILKTKNKKQKKQKIKKILKTKNKKQKNKK